MHACIIVECCQRDMLRPLVGHVEQVHELHCRLHGHVHLALFQHQQSDVLLQALQCSLQGKKQETSDKRIRMHTAMQCHAVPGPHAQRHY